MADQVNDFLKDYQAFAQQSWDSWMRFMQQPVGTTPPPTSAPNATDDLLARSLGSLQAYTQWLQQAANMNPAAPQTGMGWGAPIAPMFDAFIQPFQQAMSGLESVGFPGMDPQWQAWLQGMHRHAAPSMPPMFAPLGITREFQLQQQALQNAVQEYVKFYSRHQTLLQQVNAQGISRLQETLGKVASESGHHVESLKALYDMWVDAMESAYAEMALTEEFRDTFGAMVNAQMQVRKLQQEQVEQWCRELGVPTRSEVDSLGQRVQQLRRDMQAVRRATLGDEPDVDAMQAEIDELKRELAKSKASKVQPIRRNNSEATHGKASASARKASSTTGSKRSK